MLDTPVACNYKHVMVVNDDSSVISKWSFKLSDDPRVIIYNRQRFMIQATVPIRTQKLNNNGPGKYLTGRPSKEFLVLVVLLW